jgi:hypothetical protein
MTNFKRFTCTSHYNEQKDNVTALERPVNKEKRNFRKLKK